VTGTFSTGGKPGTRTEIVIAAAADGDRDQGPPTTRTGWGAAWTTRQIDSIVVGTHP
jgi:hypothetical protein